MIKDVIMRETVLKGRSEATRYRGLGYACKLYWNHLAKAACLAMQEMPGAPNLLTVQSRIVRFYDERMR